MDEQGSVTPMNKSGTDTGYESEQHQINYLTSILRIAQTTGGKLALLIALVSFLIALAFVPNFFGDDDTSTPSNDGGDAATELVQNGPEATDPDNGEAAPVASPLADPEVERVQGGSIHQITPETPDLDRDSGFCLDYSEQIEGPFRLLLTACTDTPGFEVVHDVEAGTIAGQIDLDLTCPGLDDCRGQDPVTGTVSGSFGPFAYGQQPEDAPADWPFPAHHWYSGSQFWWAGGPIELDVSIDGDYHILENAYSATEATTITGWVQSRLSPTSRKPGELPTEWMVDVGIIFDYGESIEPRWDFYFGYFWMFEEHPGFDIPSWTK